MDKYVFAITGPTGSGKSTVSLKMRQLGVDVIDADKVAHEITDLNLDCLSELRGAFGDTIFDGNQLNRKKLGAIVFSNDNKLKLLNKITHKYIKEKIVNLIKNSSADIVAIDGAVIIGSPVFDLVSKVVVVTASKELRMSRIMNRDGISEAVAMNRISSQMENEEYEAYADFVIKNDNNVRLGEHIEEIYRNIKNLSKARREKDSQKKKTK